MLHPTYIQVERHIGVAFIQVPVVFGLETQLAERRCSSRMRKGSFLCGGSMSAMGENLSETQAWLRVFFLMTWPPPSCLKQGAPQLVEVTQVGWMQEKKGRKQTLFLDSRFTSQSAQQINPPTHDGGVAFPPPIIHRDWSLRSGEGAGMVDACRLRVVGITWHQV